LGATGPPGVNRAVGAGADRARKAASHGRAGLFDLAERARDAALDVDARPFDGAAGRALASAEADPAGELVGQKVELLARVLGGLSALRRSEIRDGSAPRRHDGGPGLPQEPASPAT